MVTTMLDEKEKLIQELVDCLQWYVDEDETYEGGHWEEDNAYWLEGKRKAINLISKANQVLPHR